MSFNGKTTLQKGGRDPPDVSLEYVVNDLLSYLYKIDKYHDAKTEAEDKYSIKKEHDNCWPADDIKRAWGKTQRMKEKSTRSHWSLVIMMQVIERQIKRKEQSDMMEAGNLVHRCKELSVNDTSDQMKARRENKRMDDGLQSTSVNPKRKKVISEDRSTQSSAGWGTMGAAGGVKQHSGGNHQTSSSGQTGGVSRETIYIRIPHFIMIHNEQIEREQLGTIQSPCKLIDGLPEPVHANSEIRIRKKKSYVMSFNHQTGNANWVYEILNVNTTADHIKPVNRAPFGPDYHKGHLAAAANHKWCQEASNDADLFSNIVPQHRALNTGPWVALENECRRKAQGQNNIHVYSGPLYLREMVPPVIQEKRVPSHFFKVIIKEGLNGRVNQLECHKTPNGNLPRDPDRNLPEENLSTDTGTTIEQIQQDSGLTFIERRPNVGQNAMANQITVRLYGVDGNTVPRTADIQVTINSFV